MNTHKNFVRVRMLIADNQMERAKQVLTGIEGDLIKNIKQTERPLIEQYAKARVLRSKFLDRVSINKRFSR